MMSILEDKPDPIRPLIPEELEVLKDYRTKEALAMRVWELESALLNMNTSLNKQANKALDAYKFTKIK